mmetsp:Transcript_9915/g.32723  ORF Transcript_9915/g.32723 Transcript_9915/m.32723 type:complete len:225 (+) Transcript_9915:201-875(+)
MRARSSTSPSSARRPGRRPRRRTPTCEKDRRATARTGATKPTANKEGWPSIIIIKNRLCPGRASQAPAASASVALVARFDVPALVGLLDDLCCEVVAEDAVCPGEAVAVAVDLHRPRRRVDGDAAPAEDCVRQARRVELVQQGPRGVLVVVGRADPRDVVQPGGLDDDVLLDALLQRAPRDCCRTGPRRARAAAAHRRGLGALLGGRRRRRGRGRGRCGRRRRC